MLKDIKRITLLETGSALGQEVIAIREGAIRGVFGPFLLALSLALISPLSLPISFAL
jgi:hypothetical protein